MELEEGLKREQGNLKYLLENVAGSQYEKPQVLYENEYQVLEQS